MKRPKNQQRRAQKNEGETGNHVQNQEQKHLSPGTGNMKLYQK